MCLMFKSWTTKVSHIFKMSLNSLKVYIKMYLFKKDFINIIIKNQDGNRVLKLCTCKIVVSCDFNLKVTNAIP